mmetsp:Transcript_33619/g.44381  ORF Transcript_33619/g.44381 Transcript_33619/m.44381 type:complete len:208 (+) Transcript_33619:3323-3946(+)
MLSLRSIRRSKTVCSMIAAFLKSANLSRATLLALSCSPIRPLSHGASLNLHLKRSLKCSLKCSLNNFSSLKCSLNSFNNPSPNSHSHPSSQTISLTRGRCATPRCLGSASTLLASSAVKTLCPKRSRQYRSPLSPCKLPSLLSPPLSLHRPPSQSPPSLSTATSHLRSTSLASRHSHRPTTRSLSRRSRPHATSPTLRTASSERSSS